MAPQMESNPGGKCSVPPSYVSGRLAPLTIAARISCGTNYVVAMLDARTLAYPQGKGRSPIQTRKMPTGFLQHATLERHRVGCPVHWHHCASRENRRGRSETGGWSQIRPRRRMRQVWGSTKLLIHLARRFGWGEGGGPKLGSHADYVATPRTLGPPPASALSQNHRQNDRRMLQGVDDVPA